MSSPAYPTRRDGVDSLELDGETVTFDGERVTYLDASATAVWRLVDGRTMDIDIVAALSREFGVDPAEMNAHVVAAIRAFRDAGLVG